MSIPEYFPVEVESNVVDHTLSHFRKATLDEADEDEKWDSSVFEEVSQAVDIPLSLKKGAAAAARHSQEQQRHRTQLPAGNDNDQRHNQWLGDIMWDTPGEEAVWNEVQTLLSPEILAVIPPALARRTVRGWAAEEPRASSTAKGLEAVVQVGAAG